MSTAVSLRGIGRQLDDQTSLGRALDELLAARAEPPTVLALGEPTHGIKAFPLLRNEILSHLVDRGYRSIALETDFFAATIVDDYVCGGPADVDEVLATGFTHGFGNVPGNRELVAWLREHNADRPPHDRVRFYGFDAPTETAYAPSPRHALSSVTDYLSATLRPRDMETLLGDDADWTNQAAMYDPTASIGGSDRVRELRLIADDLASALRRAAPALRPADPTGYAQAVAHARTAQSLLRYHAAMASPAPDRIATLLSIRAEMMADNLLTIVAQEQHRGPTLAFAHNMHLQPAQSEITFGEDDVAWGSAGALAALTLGEHYVFIATDGNPNSTPNTLQGVLTEATTRRALFPTQALQAALPPSITEDTPILPGHLPVKPADLNGTDAIIFITDTDGVRHQYW